MSQDSYADIVTPIVVTVCMGGIIMLTLFLGQASESTGQSTAAVAKIFSSFDALANPEVLINHLQQLHIVLAGVFVACGLVCLIQGFRLYKGVVLIIAAITGIAFGHAMGQHIRAPLIIAGCSGVLLAVVAWPLMKYAVAVAGGIAGAFIGANAWTALAKQGNLIESVSLQADDYWAGALLGLIFFGLLSFILFEVSVMVFTTFSGSVLATIGLISLLLQVEAWQPAVRSGLEANPLIIPLLVIVPAVIGFVIQQQIGGYAQLRSAHAGMDE